MNNPSSILIGPYGQVAVFDIDGQQIPELQLSIAELIGRHAQSLGASLEMYNRVVGTMRQNSDGNWRTD